ncbi:CRISPR-associated protein Cas5, Hmari subtype [Natrialba chahannaoensis JCM 10990]|uniref:CRISPR-associated protein Cas5, Hmari subtype n=1 Tax=Natrialba chahannaoensis JCM 10990 TaxID=1227492 RepID=M0AD11_9EURY|nr:type I-B CRISPR-associated protein Cas5b [Natrialba chahannaoensis]ELY96630.1 CRISPR-associated protein Cas5, Hmari subtype [Natrialba chahannaoensis JCM 10990]
MTSASPPEAISFTISGEWAHFRRIDTTTAKQTYRVIPRTTVIGLLAGILGYDRDSYYDDFHPDKCDIAVSLETEVSTMAVPQTELTTEGAYRSSRGGHDVEAAFLKVEKTLEDRQRNFYEYLTDMSYRIDVCHSDAEIRADLHDMLSAGESVYTPSLGKSECLASISYHGKSETVSVESDVAHSVVPLDAAVPTGQHIATERSPRHMVRDGRSRRTTDFGAYAYRKDGTTNSLEVRDEATVFEIHDRPVTFM